MENGIKIGQTAMLKSGGPRMTIVSICEWVVECVWFAPDGEKGVYLRDSFPPESLTIFE